MLIIPSSDWVDLFSALFAWSFVKYMATKKTTKTLKINIPLCTTNEFEEILLLIIKYIQIQTSKKPVFRPIFLIFYGKSCKMG